MDTTDDVFEKIDGTPMPGSHVIAIFRGDHLAPMGYVFMPEGTTDQPYEEDVLLEGWVHFPEVDSGSSNMPIREPLKQFLALPGLEILKVVATHMGEDLAWRARLEHQLE